MLPELFTGTRAAGGLALDPLAAFTLYPAGRPLNASTRRSSFTHARPGLDALPASRRRSACTLAALDPWRDPGDRLTQAGK